MITMSCTPEYLLKKYTEELAELEKSQKELEEAYEKYIALDKQLDTIEGKISALTELVTPHSHIDLETDYGSSADELSERTAVSDGWLSVGELAERTLFSDS